MMPRTKLGRLRVIFMDASAAEFARLAQERGCRTLTPSRLRKIEQAEVQARPDEKKVIADILGLKPWEVTT